MNIFDYLILLLFLLFFISLLIPNKTASRKFFVVSSVILLVIVQGLRADHIGTDLPVYKIQYNSIQFQPFNRIATYWGFELGYNFLVWSLSKIGISFQIFLITVSIFFNVIFGKFLYRFSPNILLSLILYLFFGIYDFGFSGIRQIIAMGLVLQSTHYIYDKKKYPFLILILLATSIHKVSIIFLPLYFLINNSLVNKYYLKAFPLIFIVNLLFAKLFSFRILNLLSIDLAYYNSTFHFGANELILLGIVIIFCVSYLINRNQLFNNSINNIFLVIFTITLLIQSYGVYSYMFSRLNLFTYQYLCVYLPILFKLIFSENSTSKNTYYNSIVLLRVTLSFFIICTIAIMCHILLLRAPHGILPYSFFWN